MKQKEIFLNSEGDAYFDRNQNTNIDFSKDTPVIDEILKIQAYLNNTSVGGGWREPLCILEVGCGQGERLSWLSNNIPCDVYGIDPSEKALTKARGLGVNACKGTADLLPYEVSYFDIVIFGFCLYVCDQDDLFSIAKETNRVLKDQGWIIIRDFYSSTSFRNNYHHHQDIKTHKMDFSKMFSWHPSFTLFSLKISHHNNFQFYTDDPQQWVATQVIRKRMITND